MLNDETFEFGQARLKLKESLRFTVRTIGRRASYLVEDETTGRFFRLGRSQYTFLTMLDGRRTVSTAMMKCATLLRQDAIDEAETALLCKWAIESGLVESETGNSAERRHEQHSNHQKQKLMSWVNPLMLRIPLCNPDRFVSAATQYLGFLVSPVGAIVWLATVVWGFFQLAPHLNRFYTQRSDSFGFHDIVWIGVSWLLLKLVHELAHSIVSCKFGGRTHTCGVLLLMMIPMPFVDLTSSWKFDNKWKRILTSAAGMMMEIFVAAIACMVWVHSSPGPLQYHAGNLIISATLHTLLFNINPLMRFDGYYMLADYLEIPNLSGHGRQWLKNVFSWMYFGKQVPPLKETGYRALAVRVYGVLAMVWSTSVFLGLTLAACSLIEGFGLLIAVSSVVLWLGVPLVKLLRYLVAGTDFERPNRLWFSCAVLVTFVAVGSFLFLCPSPSAMSAPVVFDYEPLSIVRSKTHGFASKLHVEDGQTVEKGDLLISLSNPDMQHELTSLQTDIEISKLTINTLLSENRISQMQIEEESMKSMKQRYAELTDHVANLEVRAPQSGTIIARDLASIEGKYFSPGQELVSIGTPGLIHAIALAEQTDIDWIKNDTQRTVEVFVWGRNCSEMVQGRIKHVDPRARDQVVHEAFAATAGGPLDVVSRQQSDGESESNNTASGLKLTQPRVAIEIELFDAADCRLLAGQTGELIARSRSSNMGAFLGGKAIRFVSNNMHRTHGL